MRVLTLITATLFASLGYAQRTTEDQPANYSSVERAVAKVVSNDVMNSASFGFYAVNLETGDVVAAYDEDVALIPASIQKVITTSTALEEFGASKKFETTIQYDGEIDSMGVLHGNIYIKGGGDPALGSYMFESDYSGFLQNWAKAIVDLGITKVEGGVIADATVFNEDMIPISWIWGDIGNYFGAGASGLSVYDNLCRLHFKSGYNSGDSTWVTYTEPEVPYMVLDNQVLAWDTKSDEAYAYGGPYEYLRMVNGKIPKGRSDFEVKISLPDPPYLLAIQLADELTGMGIEISEEPTTSRNLRLEGVVVTDGNRTDVYTTYSPTLSSIVYYTNIKSVNMFAENLLCHIGNGSSYSGTFNIQDFWAGKGVDTEGMYVNDGSGLSRATVATAKQFVGILDYMEGSTNFNTLWKSLPVAGESGSLRSMCQGTLAEGNVRAKSGYMTRVRSYAGYVDTQSGDRIAFAMIANNFNCTPTTMRQLMETIMVAMAELP